MANLGENFVTNAADPPPKSRKPPGFAQFIFAEDVKS